MKQQGFVGVISVARHLSAAMNKCNFKKRIFAFIDRFTGQNERYLTEQFV